MSLVLIWRSLWRGLRSKSFRLSHEKSEYKKSPAVPNNTQECALNVKR